MRRWGRESMDCCTMCIRLYTGCMPRHALGDGLDDGWDFTAKPAVFQYLSYIWRFGCSSIYGTVNPRSGIAANIFVGYKRIGQITDWVQVINIFPLFRPVCHYIMIMYWYISLEDSEVYVIAHVFSSVFFPFENHGQIWKSKWSTEESC